MIFTSATFLIIFFPFCILSYYFMKETFRNGFLFLISVLFYAWCGLKFLLLILLSATAAYVFGQVIDNGRTERIRKLALLLGIIFSLALLIYYKYFFDMAEVFIRCVFTVPGKERAFKLSPPALPLGISFYTFSVLSYLLDVYWGKCPAQKNIIQLYTYVLFFPKVIQGPIMQYTDFYVQMDSRRLNMETVDSGIELFIKGMVKKVMIADQLQPFISYSFENIGGAGTLPAWLGLLAYLLRLYYDFSGYSDMAIGLGRMMGCSLPQNFDHPYISASVAEFWRRWHITLGEWFRNYVYMPCSRTLMKKGWVKKFKNPILVCDIISLAVVWLLTGIWHGSGIKYLVWGIWFFIFIAFEHIRHYWRKKKRKQKRLSVKKDTLRQRITDRILTVIAFTFGQVIFGADSLWTAIRYWKRLIVWDKRDGLLFFHQFNNYSVFILVVGIVFCFPIYSHIRKIFEKNVFLKGVYKLSLLGVFFMVFCYAMSAGYSSFMYEVF